MTRAAAADLRRWVERLAMMLEREGLPRMAGRIFGWLLVCEPAEQTLDDLAAALQGSKASMSTMTRVLVQAGLIERVRPPGARRDHFRINHGQWERLWRSRLDLLRETTALVRDGLSLVSARPAGVRRRLEELHAQYAFFERELPRLVARWEREAAAATAGRAAAARAPRGRGAGRA